MQGRLKRLSHYINRTASLMVSVNELGLSPLTLDVQNATWSANQASKISVLAQNEQDVFLWYLRLISQKNKASLGLVIPILQTNYINLDSIDLIDTEKNVFTLIFQAGSR